ncbi:hypothetical protein AB5N19_03612 [Seiridium cardinale]
MFTLPDNPYEVLNVTKNAQIPEIRSAHRKLVLKCHPDKVTDPALKAIKAEEFQKVQKAYELLSNENERQKYDDMVRANELEKENAERRRQREREFTPGRTPPRSYDSDYGRSPHYTVHVKPEPAFKVRTAEPPPFTKSSTWAPAGSKSPYTSSTRTPPRSYEDMNHYSSYDDLPPRDSRESRRSRKASVVYEEKVPSRHDEERRSRKKAEAQEEYDRQQEKARRKEEQKREAQREAAREAERKELERKEKERRKEEKKRAEKLAEKVRDTERKRETDDKRSRHKTPYVEEDSDHIIFNAAPSKSEKKSKSSSRSKENPAQIRELRERDLKSDRDIKHNATLDFAAQYLETSRSKGAPGLPRRQTYHYSSAPPPPAVATPPPAAAGVAPPPPMPSMAERMYEEDDEPVMRSSANRRRMSHDSPKVKEKSSSSSHKKSSSAREPEYVAEPTRPVAGLKKSSTMPPGHVQQGTPPNSDSPPKMHRAQTEYVRPVPGPMPGISRTTTWAPGEDMRERSRSRQKYYTDDESEEEPRPRRSRRTRSPDEAANTFTYKVENGRTKATPRSGYRDESPVGRRSGKASYYMPEANSGRPLEHRPAMHSHDSYSSQHFPKVKTARAYDMGDVMYSDVPHAPSYSAREAGYGYA